MVLKPNLVHGDALHARTHLLAGNALSDKCYAERNRITARCTLLGWPQKLTPQEERYNPINYCQGNQNELELMRCLNVSGESNWWSDFAGCSSADQCIDQALQKHIALTR